MKLAMNAAMKSARCRNKVSNIAAINVGSDRFVADFARVKSEYGFSAKVAAGGAQ
jgi:hypothetical protein